MGVENDDAEPPSTDHCWQLQRLRALDFELITVPCVTGTRDGANPDVSPFFLPESRQLLISSMTTSVGAKVLAEVYRLHHIPLPPITLQELLKRGPGASPAIAATLQNDPQALNKWREVNAPAIVTSAQLLHREVPIRISRRIVDLENLPDELPQAKPIVSLREQLLSSFDQLMSCPLPANLAGERDFMELHRKIRKEHATMHGNIAEAVQALKYEPQGLSESLDHFYNSRIGIRMLVDQHLAAQTPKPGFTGIVHNECSPMAIAQEIALKVRPMWQESLDGEQLPAIIVSGDEQATYRYVSEHVEIILTEVLKNAVLNSVAAAKRAGIGSPPPVNVLVSGGLHGMCVKVSDLGGGMTRKEANALSNYYRTATDPSCDGYDPVAEALERRAMGLDFSDSFGLRIAQLYARYFGGELAIMPMEGHGVETYIYMKCLTGDSELK
uniref:Protein-serine/threonine kinase n=1 Tax=Peronospora matthiolae TaxID=2874970 RepID=A0AAV1T6M0_9STRA